MVESVGVSKNGGIRASTEKLSGRLPEKDRISVSLEKWWNSGEYREKFEFVWVPKKYPDEYLKMIESVWVPK